MDFQSSIKAYKNFLQGQGIHEIENLRLETAVESLLDWSDIMTIEQLRNWILGLHKNCNMNIKEVQLDKLSDWKIHNNEKIIHEKNSFFSVIGISISNSSSREVRSGWDQPIILEKNNNGGIVGLVRKKIMNSCLRCIVNKRTRSNEKLTQFRLFS